MEGLKLSSIVDLLQREDYFVHFKLTPNMGLTIDGRSSPGYLFLEEDPQLKQRECYLPLCSHTQPVRDLHPTYDQLWRRRFLVLVGSEKENADYLSENFGFVEGSFRIDLPDLLQSKAISKETKEQFRESVRKDLMRNSFGRLKERRDELERLFDYDWKRVGTMINDRLELVAEEETMMATVFDRGYGRGQISEDVRGLSSDCYSEIEKCGLRFVIWKVLESAATELHQRLRDDLQYISSFKEDLSFRSPLNRGLKWLISDEKKLASSKSLVDLYCLVAAYARLGRERMEALYTEASKSNVDTLSAIADKVVARTQKHF